MNKKKIFLGTPITPLLFDNGVVDNEIVESIERIIADLRKNGYEVFCAIEREKWGEELLPGMVCTKLDYEEMKKADIFISIPNDSYGVYLELGWASALQTPILLMVNENIGLKTPLGEGLPTITKAKIIFFKILSLFPDESEWENVRENVFKNINAIMKGEMIFDV